VEMSAGEPLISMRPFVLLRSGRPGWCRKIPPFSQAPCPVILNLLHILLHTLPSSPYRENTKNTRVTKILCSQYCGKTKQTWRNVRIRSSWECNMWPVSHHDPWILHLPALGRLANNKIYWPILCYMSLLTACSR